jgi:hypothetical protein
MVGVTNRSVVNLMATTATIIKMGTFIDIWLTLRTGVLSNGMITQISKVRKYPPPIEIIPPVKSVKGSNPENKKKRIMKNLLVDRCDSVLVF